MKNKAIVLLHSFDELISCLTDEEAGRLLKAIFDYDIRGNTTEFEDRAVMFLYKQICNCLDTHKTHYKKVCNERKKSAEKRWCASEAEEKSTEAMQMHANAYSEMQMHANAYNININEKENIKVNVNEKENINENVCVNEIKAAGFENADTHTHKKAYGEFSNVYLTDEEYRHVMTKLPDGKRRLQSLSAYIEATGKRYSNHYAQLLNWSFYGNEPSLRTGEGYGAKSRKPPGERREPTFDVSEFTKKALNPVFVPPTE